MGRGRKRRSLGLDPSGCGVGAAGGKGGSGGSSSGGSTTPFATAAGSAERLGPRATYSDNQDGAERAQGGRRWPSSGGNGGKEEAGGQQQGMGQQRQQRPRRQSPQSRKEEGGGGGVWDRPAGHWQDRYPQQQQGNGGGYNHNNRPRRPPGGGGGGERTYNRQGKSHYGQGLPAGGWLSMAHHRGEDAQERLITSQLKNAGNAGGVPALLEKAQECMAELNAVHCTMVINRCVSLSC